MTDNRLRIWIGPLARRPGGGARYIQSLAAHSRHRFVVGKEVPEIVWGLRWLGRRIPPAPHALPAFVRIAQRCRVAHIHRSVEYGQVLGSMPRTLPWIFTLHGVGFEEPWTEQPEMIRYVREYNRAALEVIGAAPMATVVARWLRDYVEERTSASPAVTPPGIDLTEFEHTGPAEFLQHSGLAPGFILWVGRLALEKGLEGFVRLANRMRARTFVIVTDRPEGEARSQGLPLLPPNIRYFSRLPRALVVSAFHGCSVYVSTSLYDAAPTTFLEAMACRKPVVGPNLLGPREIIQDSGSGYLYDPVSPDDLEHQVLAALDHPELGIRGHAFVRENRDWQKLAQYFDRQYEELASQA